MKAFTDIEQSKKLADILPIESADAHYVRESTDLMGNPVNGKWSETKLGNPEKANYIVQNFTNYEILPCWSLSALLGVLPYPTLAQHANGLWSLTAWVGTVEPYSIDGYDNKIDAVFEMIIKLNELDLL